VPSSNPQERDPNLARLVEKIAQERHFGFDAYKESCFRRRVAVRMRARDVSSYDEYAALLDRDDDEYDKLLDALTINVTKFFRNLETWDVLAREILFVLWRERQGRVRCWSAGCASGEEPYTLAILMAELAQQDGSDLSSVSIDATDLDAASLARARHGAYEESAFEEMPPGLLRQYFSEGAPRMIDGSLKARVDFMRHDIIGDPPPSPPYDLIICRNVLIYFDRLTQDRVIAGLIDALRCGGYLVLGRSETLLGSLRNRLVLINARERIYRRP
jgi:chemotaxis methyl-accepting protein methylase